MNQRYWHLLQFSHCQDSDALIKIDGAAMDFFIISTGVLIEKKLKLQLQEKMTVNMKLIPFGLHFSKF